ncbi:MAG TPA: hypothetical protein VFO89_10355, partial [Thermoanaerobaculia bacterium]|nr:hypothetical protein [Thermoanaerobaculia bacterium]
MPGEYFEEIEAHFARRRGTPFVLNAKDWALMKSWHEAGIPLPVVIEALDSVFDKREAQGKKVNSLSYCRHAVKELWDERKELQIGAEGAAPEESPQALLDALAQKFESSPHEAVRAFASRVRALAGAQSVPRIEEKLVELEQELVDALASDDLRAEAQTLSATAGEKTRARTEAAHLRRLVRERFEVPRLTL